MDDDVTRCILTSLGGPVWAWIRAQGSFSPVRIKYYFILFWLFLFCGILSLGFPFIAFIVIISITLLEMEYWINNYPEQESKTGGNYEDISNLVNLTKNGTIRWSRHSVPVFADNRTVVLYHTTYDEREYLLQVAPETRIFLDFFPVAKIRSLEQKQVGETARDAHKINCSEEAFFDLWKVVEQTATMSEAAFARFTLDCLER